MRTIAFMIAMGWMVAAAAEMHVVVPAPILTVKDAKGAQQERTTKMMVTDTVIDPQTKQVLSSTAKPTEYHLMADDGFDYKAAGASYAATWDQKAPCINVLLGDPKVIHLGYLGWPTIDCVTWQAEQPAAK